MQIHFKTREQARKADFGKLVDNGTTAQHGKRFGREVTDKALIYGMQPAWRSEHRKMVYCQSSGRFIPVFVRGKNKL